MATETKPASKPPTRVFLCDLGHGVDEPKGLRGEALDRYVLSHSPRVSTFWITDTLARAKRVTKWQKSGELVLNNKDHDYPWLGVAWFNPRRNKDYTIEELAQMPPSKWMLLLDSQFKLSTSRLCDIASYAERLLLLCEYVETRIGADGCGLKTHDDAAKAVAKLHLKLRKALGYSYPAQGVLKL